MAKTAEEKAASAKNARLKRFFDIDLAQYKQVEDFQFRDSTLCILLGTDVARRGLAVGRRALDHNHTSGQLRGILDWRINRALGLVENAYKEDTPLVLRALAHYIENFPVTTVLGPRYGIIGKAKKKKVMIYGSPTGPIKPEKKVRKCKSR